MKKLIIDFGIINKQFYLELDVDRVERWEKYACEVSLDLDTSLDKHVFDLVLTNPDGRVTCALLVTKKDLDLAFALETPLKGELTVMTRARAPISRNIPVSDAPFLVLRAVECRMILLPELRHASLVTRLPHEVDLHALEDFDALANPRELRVEAAPGAPFAHFFV